MTREKRRRRNTGPRGADMQSSCTAVSRRLPPLDSGPGREGRWAGFCTRGCGVDRREGAWHAGQAFRRTPRACYLACRLGGRLHVSFSVCCAVLCCELLFQKGKLRSVPRGCDDMRRRRSCSVDAVEE